MAPTEKSFKVPAYDIAAPTDPILIQLFDYWDSKRGARKMPSRADIDAIELRGLVSHMMLLDAEPDQLYRIRLVGQAVADFVGTNNTGMPVTDGMPPSGVKQTIEILDSLVAKRSPRFRRGRAHWHPDKSYREFEACFLPLSTDGQVVDKVLFGGVVLDADGIK